MRGQKLPMALIRIGLSVRQGGCVCEVFSHGFHCCLLGPRFHCYYCRFCATSHRCSDSHESMTEQSAQSLTARRKDRPVRAPGPQGTPISEEILVPSRGWNGNNSSR